jgi:hypothetical protein
MNLGSLETGNVTMTSRSRDIPIRIRGHEHDAAMQVTAEESHQPPDSICNRADDFAVPISDVYLFVRATSAWQDVD